MDKASELIAETDLLYLLQEAQLILEGELDSYVCNAGALEPEDSLDAFILSSDGQSPVACDLHGNPLPRGSGSDEPYFKLASLRPVFQNLARSLGAAEQAGVDLWASIIEQGPQNFMSMACK